MTRPPQSMSPHDPALVDRAVAAADSGIVIADATLPDFPITYVNAAFETLTGYDEADALGRNCRFLQGPGTDLAAVAEIHSALEECRDVRVVLLNYRKDGSPFYNELRLSMVTQGDRVINVVGVQNDVTKLVEAAHRLEADRDRAVADLRGFQDVLTPADVLPRPQLDLGVVFEPVEQGVAGDFHLVVPGRGDATIMVVGDAMGHGLAAATRATFVRATMATFARVTDDPHRLLSMANEALIGKTGTSAHFVTAVCATYEPASRRLRWASAGHPAPLRLDRGSPLHASGTVGMALGVAVDLGGSTAEARLSRGEGVVLCTDGLLEARSDRALVGPATRLGDARVCQLLQQTAGRPAAEVAGALRDAAHAHAGGRLEDDLCIIAARST